MSCCDCRTGPRPVSASSRHPLVWRAQDPAPLKQRQEPVSSQGPGECQRQSRKARRLAGCPELRPAPPRPKTQLSIPTDHSESLNTKTRQGVQPCPVGLRREQVKPLNRVSPSTVQWTQEGPRRSGLEGEAEPWGTPGQQRLQDRAPLTGIEPGLEAACPQTVSKASNSPTPASAALSPNHSPTRSLAGPTPKGPRSSPAAPHGHWG